MVWYTGEDKKIYDSGIHFRPQQKYLTTDYEWPTEGDGGGGGDDTNYGIPAASGGGNWNPYNHPGSGRKYNPYALQDARYDNEMSYVGRPIGSWKGYSSDTEAMKHMEMYPEHYGLDKPPPSKVNQFLSKAVNWIPGVGYVKKGLEAVSDLLPTNRRAIMENEMIGSGVMLDDIGRIITTDYNTPQGIMAGYNAYQMDEDTFDDRISKIQAGKMSAEGKRKRIALIRKAKENWQTAQGKTDEIVDIKTDTKSDISPNATDTDQVTDIITGQDKGGEADVWQETFSGTGNQGGEFNNTGWSPGSGSQGSTQTGDYDFADYNQGGRVYLNLGGIASVLGTEQDRREGLRHGGLLDRREGFAEGGRNWMGDYDPGNTTGWQEKGQVETWSPGGGGETTTTFTGGGDGGGGEVPPTVVKDNFTADTDLLTTSPSAEFNYTPSQWAQIMARLSNEDVTSTDDINFEGQFTGGNNLIDYGIDFTDEGVTGGNVGLNYGDLNLQATTDLNRHNLGVNYNKGPFFVSGNIDNMGNKNVMGGVKWNFGEPDQAPVRSLSYKEENPDLIYGQNLRHGGLASLL